MGGKLGHHSSTEPAGDKNKTNTEDSASSLTKYPCRDKHPIKCQQAASFSAEFKCQAREREREKDTSGRQPARVGGLRAGDDTRVRRDPCCCCRRPMGG